jgi:hypothetical protein
MSKTETRELHIEVECPECYGNGYYEVGPECNRPASNCCGGCYRQEPCDHDHCVDGFITVTIDEDTTIQVVKHLIQNEVDEAMDLIDDQCHGICQR